MPVQVGGYISGLGSYLLSAWGALWWPSTPLAHKPNYILYHLGFSGPWMSRKVSIVVDTTIYNIFNWEGRGGKGRRHSLRRIWPFRRPSTNMHYCVGGIRAKFPANSRKLCSINPLCRTILPDSVSPSNPHPQPKKKKSLDTQEVWILLASLDFQTPQLKSSKKCQTFRVFSRNGSPTPPCNIEVYICVQLVSKVSQHWRMGGGE